MPAAQADPPAATSVPPETETVAPMRARLYAVANKGKELGLGG